MKNYIFGMSTGSLLAASFAARGPSWQFAAAIIAALLVGVRAYFDTRRRAAPPASDEVVA